MQSSGQKYNATGTYVLCSPSTISSKLVAQCVWASLILVHKAAANDILFTNSAYNKLVSPVLGHPTNHVYKSWSSRREGRNK